MKQADIESRRYEIYWRMMDNKKKTKRTVHGVKKVAKKKKGKKEDK